MISSGRAKPLPPALSKIMDGMYWWGKAKNYAWYEHVVDNLGVVLDANDDKEPDIQEIVRFLISYQVKALLVEHFDSKTRKNPILNQYFNETSHTLMKVVIL
jgi:ABC-type sugar transport system substrate-binding protein